MFKPDVVLPDLPQNASPEQQRFNEGVLKLIKNLRRDIVQKEDWIPVTYINSWVDYDATRVSKYYKDIFGYVHLTLGCKSGSSGNPFVMPEGYRPAGWIYFNIVTIQSGTTNAYIRLQSDGTVTIDGYTNNYCFAGEIIYRAA